MTAGVVHPGDRMRGAAGGMPARAREATASVC